MRASSSPINTHCSGHLPIRLLQLTSSSFTVSSSSRIVSASSTSGFSEHIGRYDTFFHKLAAEPYNLHILAFDQRGFGKTSTSPYALTSSSPEVKKWKEEGKKVNLQIWAKRKSGGWAKAMPDIEWFVKLASTQAKEAGKKLYLWGFSMVSAFGTKVEGG